MKNTIQPANTIKQGSEVNFGGSVFLVTDIEYVQPKNGFAPLLTLYLSWTGEGKHPLTVATVAHVPNPITPIVVCG
jgi:hypothetical protein